MKKILLSYVIILCAFNTSAQVSLNNPPYTENFDNIGSGLPAGFSVYTGATTPSTVGTVAAFSSTITPWATTTAGFYNCASANGLTNASDAAQQESSTNRALAVRQSASFGNPGAAFVFRIANTTNKTGFSLTLKLQTLDSATQGITAWSADYGFGANPTSFTQAIITPASSRTGGKKGTTTYIFNNSLSINFGTALDNKNDVVWIRLRAPLSTSDATWGIIYSALGITNTNPTMSGIDDWNLTWTNSPNTSTGDLYKTSEKIMISGFMGNDIRIQAKNNISSTTTVRLTNLNGAILWEKQYSRLQANQTEWVRPGNLPKGIYLLQIQNAEERMTKRLAN
jgi:hypothetical protein